MILLSLHRCAGNGMAVAITVPNAALEVCIGLHTLSNFRRSAADTLYAAVHLHKTEMWRASGLTISEKSQFSNARFVLPYCSNLPFQH